MPVGSRREEMWAVDRERWMTSFSAECRGWRPSLTEAMGGQVINLCSMKATLVGMTQGDAKMEAHSHPDGIIIHPQPQ